MRTRIPAPRWLGGLCVALLALHSLGAEAAEPLSTPATVGQGKKTNMLVIWGDDIGTWNISHNNRGMMGYRTPNMDQIAREGVGFTDDYAQQSCTADRAAFVSGFVPVRSGMTKGGMPGVDAGWQTTDVTMATILKTQGSANSQFDKNHPGDRYEHLPACTASMSSWAASIISTPRKNRRTAITRRT